MKFLFVHAQKAFFSVSRLCRVVGVTRQGYYAFAKRPVPARSKREQEIRENVREAFVQSKGRYGSPRVLRQLRNQGFHTSKRRVERAMCEMELIARPKRRFRVTTQANPSHATEPNILAREFTATKPNERWVTDIAYV